MLDNFGAMMGGTLKDAKTVRQSRIVKSANVAVGTRRGAWPGTPKICVNRLSLYRHNVRFAADVARNFEGPELTVGAGCDRTVEVAVSIVFADRYVPQYNAYGERETRLSFIPIVTGKHTNMRPNGFEPTKL